MAAKHNASFSQMVKDKKAKRNRIALFLCLAILVAGGTTAALRLYSQAMTRTVLECPLTVHAHTAECYDEAGALTCGEADYVVHVHNDDCRNEEAELVCTLPEIHPHVHTEACYETDLQPICGLEETDGPHTHGEGCYAETTVLVCGQEEPAEGGHVHSDACYSYAEFLTCGQEEVSEGAHVHSDACYTYEDALTCGQEEPTEGAHTHGDGCYTYEDLLTCEQEETPDIPAVVDEATGEEISPAIPGHVHTVNCYTRIPVLVCELEETHVHTANCYSHTLVLSCGLEETHIHTAACYTGDRVLSCGREESHIHTPDCYETVNDLVCELAETGQEAHAHSEECYGAVTQLACGQLELHTHDEALCYEYDEYGNASLICTKLALAEHVHGAECFVRIGSDDDDAWDPANGCYDELGMLVCGLEEHTHGEECYNSKGKLTCKQEEHTHTGALLTEEELNGTVTKTYRDGSVIITATYEADADIPEEAELLAYPVTAETAPDRYEQRMDDARVAAEADAGADMVASDIVIYNIGFYLNGVEIEPAAPVTITIQLLDAEGFAQGDPITVIHFHEEGTEILDSDVDEEGAAVFATEGFSDYAIAVMAAPVEAPDDMLLWLTFDRKNWDNSASGNVKATKSGSTGSQWVEHGDGYAVGLNIGGGNAYAQLENLVGPIYNSNAMTVAFWSKVANTTNGNWGFFASNNSNAQVGDSERYFGVFQNNTYGGTKAERYYNGRSSAYSGWVAQGGLDTDWHHIAVVYDANSVILYVDGVKVNASASSASLSTILGAKPLFGDDPRTMMLGKGNWGDGEYYQGYLDDYRIYNYALTQAQIQALIPGEEKDQTYTVTTINWWDLTPEDPYVVYYSNGNDIAFLAPGASNAEIPISLTNAATVAANSRTRGDTWTFPVKDLSNSNADLSWRLINLGDGSYALESTSDGYLRLIPGHVNLNTSRTGNETFILEEAAEPGITLRTSGSVTDSSGNNPGYLQLYYDGGIWSANRSNSAAVKTDAPYTLYFAKVVTPPIRAKGSNYPPSAETKGKPSTALDIFYNVTLEDGYLAGLGGVTYSVYSEDGETFIRDFTTTSSMETKFPSDIGYGTYKMWQTGAPTGYKKSPEVWKVEVTNQNGQRLVRIYDSEGTGVGILYNYKTFKFDGAKTAEVVDYIQRTYRVDITALSELLTYKAEPVHVSLVIDQSNSMLFPADLVPMKGVENITISKNGNNNVTELNNKLKDKSKVYYIINDPAHSATVYAIWWNGNAWLFQDAAYYYKAQHGVKEGNHWVCYPEASDTGTTTLHGTNRYAHGGSSIKNYDYVNGSIQFQSTPYVVYEPVKEGSNYYTRLTYLQEAMALLIREIGALNPESTVSLVQFHGVVSEDECQTEKLSPTGMQELLRTVGDISTDGGTRQDRALAHVYADQGGKHDHLSDDTSKNYVVLITDGAPVRDSDSDPSLDTIMGYVRYQAGWVKTKATLATAGLSVDNVDGGSTLLSQIATPGWAWSAQQTSQIKNLLLDKFFHQMVKEKALPVYGDIMDVISDSFYPINPDNNQPLTNGTWLRYDGHVATNAKDRAGQLLQDKNGDWYVQWLNQKIGPASAGSWHGTIYLKAKEDFIGGNAIDTNKEAHLIFNDDEDVQIDFETPTVNVRLLPMNFKNSEVTVFRDDTVNGPEGSGVFRKTPWESLEYLYELIRFTKVTGGTESIKHHDTWTLSADGDNCGDTSFNLRYAIGKFGALGTNYESWLENVWTTLAASTDKEVKFELDYTYDDPSSHGPVGYFTVLFTKADTSNCAGTDHTGWDSHPAKDAGDHVETYKVSVTFTAYGLGEAAKFGDHTPRPEENVHTGKFETESPGTEVGTGETLETGAGFTSSVNTHWVNTVFGTVIIDKKVTTAPNEQKVFKFRLSKVTGEGEKETYEIVDTVDVVVEKGNLEGSLSGTFTGLGRGKYLLEEVGGAEFHVQDIKVISAGDHQVDVQGEKAYIYIGMDTETRQYITYDPDPEEAECAHNGGHNALQYSSWITDDLMLELEVTNNNTDLQLKKVSMYDKSKGLEGAEFSLYEQEAIDSTTGKVKDGYDPIWSGVSGKDGVFSPKLPMLSSDHYYYLVETKAPTGYIMLDGPVELYVTDRGTVTIRLWNSPSYDTFEPNKKNVIPVQVPNYAAFDLPESGGPGTGWMYALGSVLMLTAFTLGLRQARRFRKKENEG